MAARDILIAVALMAMLLYVVGSPKAGEKGGAKGGEGDMPRCRRMCDECRRSDPEAYRKMYGQGLGQCVQHCGRDVEEFECPESGPPPGSWSEWSGF